jgi:hypothetical protein
MTEPRPAIPYAPATFDDAPADRLLRRIVAGAAIADGAEALVRKAVVVGLAKGWLASPRTMSWDSSTGWVRVVTDADSLVMCAMVIGGILLLRRSRWSVVLLRAAVFVQIVLAAVSQILAMRAEPTYASYFSTPGAWVVETLGLLKGLWVPALIALLTLPPLARRMI